MVIFQSLLPLRARLATPLFSYSNGLLLLRCSASSVPCLSRDKLCCHDSLFVRPLMQSIFTFIIKEDHRLDSVLSIFSALWHHDAFALQNVNLLLLYFCLALLIFLESGFLPAAPLPCDSVIVLSARSLQLVYCNCTGCLLPYSSRAGWVVWWLSTKALSSNTGE